MAVGARLIRVLNGLAQEVLYDKNPNNFVPALIKILNRYILLY